MATMTVKDLIASLQELDPDLPIHKYNNNGMPAIDTDYAGYTFQLLDLMQSKNDPTYFSRTDDWIWNDQKDHFNPPFKACVIG